MQRETQDFCGAGALPMARYRCRTTQPCVARLIFVHGWGDHIGRYANVARQLASHGIESLGFEFPGHGHSAGRRARVDDFSALVDDLRHFILEVRAETPALPLFAHGYSMGGCVTATLVAHDPQAIDGIIFHGAALALSPKISRIKVMLARWLGSALPSLPLGVLTRGELMTRDPAAATSFDNDPDTYHGPIAAATAKALLFANINVDRMLERITAPFLVLQGDADELVDPRGAHALIERAASPDKELRMFPGARHDLFLESERDAAIDAVAEFVIRRSMP